MKKLRKFLVAIAVIALVISSVAILAVTAEEQVYTGDLSEAQTLLDAVPRDHVYNGSVAIAKVYDYLKGNPIDPATPGYAEFCAELYDLALRILSEYHTKYLESGGRTDFERVYSLIALYGIPDNTPDPDGEETRYRTIIEIKTSIETASMAYAKEYYNAAVDAGSDVSTSTRQLRSLFEHIAQYPISGLVVDFEQFCYDYNDLALSITEGMVAELKTLGEQASGDAAGQDAKDAYKERLGTLLTIIRDHNKDCPVDIVRFESLKGRYDAYIEAMVGFEFDQISFLFDDFCAEDFYRKDSEGKYVYDYPELAEAATLSKVSAALKSSTVPDTREGYPELVAKIKVEEERVAKIKEERRQALSDATPLEQFAYTGTSNSSIYDNNYNDTSKTKNISHDHNTDQNKGQYKAHEDDPTNLYWNYYVLGSPNTSAYTTIYARNTSSKNEKANSALNTGFVISFDYMLENTNPNGGHFSKVTFAVRYKKGDTGTVKRDDGTGDVGFGPNLFTIEYDSESGALKIYNAKQDAIPVVTTVSNIAAEGQWFNLMMTYDPDTRYGKVYIDYQEVLTIYYRVDKSGADVLPSTAATAEFRLSQSPLAWNSMNFDNFQKYPGTTYRDLNKFKDMTDEELFMYYVDFLTGNVASLENKYYCYTHAKPLVEFMKLEYSGLEESEMTDDLKALRARVEAFEKYDKENYKQDFLPALTEEKTAEYKEMVNAILDKFTPKIDDLGTRRHLDSADIDKVLKEVSFVDAFVEEFNDIINKTDERYTSGVAEISRLRQQITACENASKFARLFVQFSRATTVASMQKRADALEEIFKLARYDKPENVAAVASDSAILAFEALINNGLDPDDEDYVTIFDYYKVQVPSIIAERQKYENSLKIVKCIDLLLALEGYEDTEAFWSANREEVEFYISIVRDIVAADNYDHSYAGINAALAQYELVDAYLYIRLQDDHIATLKEQLDKFEKSDSLIEKMGICTYVSRYFETYTNIDLTLPEIQAIKTRLATYENELEIFASDFGNILKRNTQFFIDTVKLFDGLTTYAEIKPVYDTALSYFYVMNVVDSDPVYAAEIEDAIAKFDEMSDYLVNVQINSELFVKSIQDIGYVVGLGVQYEFESLTAGAPYYEYLDKTYIELKYSLTAEELELAASPEIEGEDEVLAQKKAAAREKLVMYNLHTGNIEIYKGLYDNHNRVVDSINSASKDAIQVAIALGADKVPVSVLAIISQLIQK